VPIGFETRGTWYQVDSGPVGPWIWDLWYLVPRICEIWSQVYVGSVGIGTKSIFVGLVLMLDLVKSGLQCDVVLGPVGFGLKWIWYLCDLDRVPSGFLLAMSIGIATSNRELFLNAEFQIHNTVLEENA
jgi:hypothetical protein